MSHAERRSITRSIAIVVIGAILVAELARLVAASAYSETRPQLASALAPAAPAVLASTAMAEVGEAAAAGKDLSEKTAERLRSLAGAAPLDPQPFLVQAALAERAADYRRAELLLLAAEARDPRSPAAHYLMADVRVREGKLLESLRELAILARIMPGASLQLVGALADYARTPEARSGLSAMITENPQLKPPLLNALAADPANAELILYLYRIGSNVGGPQQTAWQSRLLDGLVRRGDYGVAYDYWRRFSGIGGGARPLIFNGDFAPADAPPPFNWSLASGSAGLAERDEGKLRVLYYGREEASLASQLLLLPAGNYRFEAATSGNVAQHALSWSLACSSGARPLVNVEIGNSSPVRAMFTVPADCPAQTLQLLGHMQDMPKDTDVRVGPVSIVSVRS